MAGDQASNPATTRTYIQRARREQLTDCAIAVLAEIGYARASLVRIAERAEVSRGVITYHFADRDDLLEAAVTRVYETARTFLQPRLEATTTAADALRTFIIGSAEFYQGWPEHMAALYEIITNARDRQGRLRHFAPGAADAQELRDLARLLERGQAAGEFCDFSPRVMARTIRHALNGLLQDMRADPDLDVMDDAEEIAAMFERALR